MTKIMKGLEIVVIKLVMFNFSVVKNNSLQEKTHQNMIVQSYNGDNQLDVVIIGVSFEL